MTGCLQKSTGPALWSCTIRGTMSISPPNQPCCLCLTESRGLHSGLHIHTMTVILPNSMPDIMVLKISRKGTGSVSSLPELWDILSQTSHFGGKEEFQRLSIISSSALLPGLSGLMCCPRDALLISAHGETVLGHIGSVPQPDGIRE